MNSGQSRDLSWKCLNLQLISQSVTPAHSVTGRTQLQWCSWGGGMLSVGRSLSSYVTLPLAFRPIPCLENWLSSFALQAANGSEDKGEGSHHEGAQSPATRGILPTAPPGNATAQLLQKCLLQQTPKVPANVSICI